MPSDAPERRSLAEQIAEAVVAYARNRRLAAGDRLPPVRELASLLSVSPSTLRESLRRLEVVGAIRIEHGSGIYLTDQLDRLIMPNPHTGQGGIARVVELLETRALLEPHLAALATTHGTLAQLAHLQGLLDEASEILDGPDDGLVRTNLGFHCGIAAMSGNSVASSVIDSLVSTFVAEQVAVLALYDHQRDLEDHRSILTRIRTGDPDGAREEMYRHLSAVKATAESQATASRRSTTRGAKAQASRTGR